MVFLSVLSTLVALPLAAFAAKGARGGRDSRAVLSALTGTSAVCTNPVESCVGTSTNLCCFNSPGGQLSQTQFWDTSPETGPTNSWTLHGLWPDHCDGTYDEDCDETRAYTNISAILTAFGKTALLDTMDIYWKNDPDDGSDEEFWEHEWETHGTCISTLEPSCYTDYTPTQEVPDFFQRAVDLFLTLDTYSALVAGGVTPSSSATYTKAKILAAIEAEFGVSATIGCSDGELDQIFYSFYVEGSVQTGTFIPVNPVGQSSSCSSTGIKWLPKTGGSPKPTTTTSAAKTTTKTTKTTATTTPSTATTTISTASATPTGGVGSFSGSGYLEAYTGGSETGCLISKGSWYTTGTCATYSVTDSGSGFTLTSSKGTCGISDSTFSCSGAANSVFTSVDGYLAYNGVNTFYSSAIPSGSTQLSVTTTENSVAVQFAFQSS